MVLIPNEKWYFNGKMVSIAVCIPSHSTWCAEFGRSLANLMQHFVKYRVAKCKGQKAVIINTQGSMLSQVRQSLLRAALTKVEATHILWLDSDMKFPPDTLHRLLLAGKKFVAAQGVTKKIPAEPVAQALDGTRCFSDPEKSGLEEVRHVGLAVALLRLTQGVRKMEPPHFTMEWIPERAAYAGEDVFFCHRLRSELDMKLYIDHDLSREIGHIGTLEYNHTLVGSIEEEEVS